MNGTAKSLPRHRTAMRKQAIGVAVVAGGSKTCPTCGTPFRPVNAKQVHCRPSCVKPRPFTTPSLFDAWSRV